METMEERLAIRERSETGRRNGERILRNMAAMLPDEQWKTEFAVGADLVYNNGVQPQQAYLQGRWHAVGETPLCFIRQLIDYEAADVKRE